MSTWLGVGCAVSGPTPAALLGGSAFSGFVSDTFTDTNGTAITSHTGEVGATWTLAIGSATLTVNAAGRLAAGSSGAATLFYASGAPSTADYSASCDVVVATSNGDCETGPAVRMATAARTCYELVPNSTVFSIVRFVTGTGVVLGSSGAVSGGILNSETYRLTLSVSGTSLTGKVQRASDSNFLTSAGAWQVASANAISVTDSAIAGPGKAGLTTGGAAANNGTTVDNFSAA